jgi:hypothetical protein
MPTPDSDPPAEGSGTSCLDWESRALARVEGHFRELAAPADSADVGWEISTVALLSGYFERGSD